MSSMLPKTLNFFLLSITSMLLLQTSFAQKEYDLEAQKRAKNKVIKMYQYKIDLQSGDSVLYAVENYNRKGRLVLYSSIDKNGQVESRQMITFDSNGYAISLLCEDKDGKRSYKYVYVNDKQGNQIESTQFGAHDSIRYAPQRRVYDNKSEKVYNYNESSGRFYLASKHELTKSGKYSRILIYSRSDSTVPKTINLYEYDKKDNLIAVYSLDGDSKIQLSSYAYDKRGNLTELIKLNRGDRIKDGKIIYKANNKVVKYSYDRNNNLLEEQHFTSGEKTEHVGFRYETRD